MATVSPTIARSMVLRCLPRLLRAGLDHDGCNGSLPHELVRDLGAVAPPLQDVAMRWLDAQSGQPSTPSPVSAGAIRRLIERIRDRSDPHGPTPRGPDGLAALDRHAADTDDETVREIADALLILGASGNVQRASSHLAKRAWDQLDRLPEIETVLHRLGLLAAASGEGKHGLDHSWLDALAELEPAMALAGHPVPAEGVGALHPDLRAAFDALRIEARLLAIGLSAISAGRVLPYYGDDSLAGHARAVGRVESEPLEIRAEVRERERMQRDFTACEIARLAAEARASMPEATQDPVPEPNVIARPGQIMVCPGSSATGAGKGRDVARGYEHAIGRSLPLVETRDLSAVRSELLPEFPYAEEALDAVLGAFAGKTHVRAAPLLIEGPPGAGKSLFVRRLGQALGVGVFRVDASNDGGAAFGGTERRWYSSEPCRPFMAVARYGHANPLVLVDELDKAPSRSDYGRIWDSMLQVLEPENAARFPDPCLQTELDISWVSVLSTANDASKLPGPLLDRMRVVRFPPPEAGHLDTLLPAVLASIAAERGIDPRFLTMPDGIERTALRRRWKGGSVRRLRRAVEAVLRVRDSQQKGAPQ